MKRIWVAATKYGTVFWRPEGFKHYIDENDANWRPEYFAPLMQYLMVEVIAVPFSQAPSFVKKYVKEIEND